MEIINQLVNDDWERLIIDGKTVYEGHDISCYHTLDALKEAGIIKDFKQETVTEET